MSHPLDDPFSRVHPFFWPVLWLSLRAFVRWSGAMMEAGHGFAGLSLEITWYGTIHVTRLDLSSEGEAFRRHMAGTVPPAGWNEGLGVIGPRLVWSSDRATCAPLSHAWERGGGEGSGASIRALMHVLAAAPLPLAPLPQAGEGNARVWFRAMQDTS